tara:strand:- start:13 stop:444 length:432 start_codon:yes stop_codon:yes gene_type:complete
MFSIFKKKRIETVQNETNFEIELVAVVLAYEIARSDGEITETELNPILDEIKKISIKVGKDENEIFKIIESYSKDSISFYEFIEDINKDFSKVEKLSLISFLWEVAYADSKLDTDEERLVRRIADLINIKDIEVLKLKDKAKS